MDESTEKLTSAALRLPPADRAAGADPSRVRPAADTFAAVRERFPAEDDPSR